MAIKSQAIVRNVQNVAERIAHPTINHIFHLLACKCSFIQSTFSLSVCVKIYIFSFTNLCARYFFLSTHCYLYCFMLKAFHLFIVVLCFVFRFTLVIINGKGSPMVPAIKLESDIIITSRKWLCIGRFTFRTQPR